MRAATWERTASRRARLGFHLVGVGLATTVAVAVAAPASAQPLDPGPQLMADVAPQEVAGNPTFDDLGFDCEFTLKVEEPVTMGMFGPVAIFNVIADQLFDFSLSGNLITTGVIVKGGPNANLYDYRGLGGVSGDEQLHAPLNVNTPNPFDFFELSHVDFCIVTDENGYDGGNSINGVSRGNEHIGEQQVDSHHA